MSATSKKPNYKINVESSIKELRDNIDFIKNNNIKDEQLIEDLLNDIKNLCKYIMQHRKS